MEYNVGGPSIFMSSSNLAQYPTFSVGLHRLAVYPTQRKKDYEGSKEVAVVSEESWSQMRQQQTLGSPPTYIPLRTVQHSKQNTTI